MVGHFVTCNAILRGIYCVHRKYSLQSLNKDFLRFQTNFNCTLVCMLMDADHCAQTPSRSNNTALNMTKSLNKCNTTKPFNRNMTIANKFKMQLYKNIMHTYIHSYIHALIRTHRNFKIYLYMNRIKLKRQTKQNFTTARKKQTILPYTYIQTLLQNDKCPKSKSPRSIIFETVFYMNE